MNLYFMNDSVFNSVAMMTFGVSAKENNNSIGIFGTGFKYAVAIILKLGGKIKVTSGDDEYIFTRKTETIRKVDFEVVYMNGISAGFTTRLGMNWSSWMAFRELYSNCLDEKGVVSEVYQDSTTVVEVDCREISDAFMNKDSYFLSREPIYCGNEVDIYAGGTGYVYYRGVAVCDVDESKYAFNIKTSIDLSEERTARYSFQWRDPIAKEFQRMTDENLIRSILTSELKFDRSINYTENSYMSDEFVSTAKMLLHTDIGISEGARLAISKKDERDGNYPELLLTKSQLIMLNKAKVFLESIGITVDDFPVMAVKGLGDSVMGRAINGTIYLSIIPFHQGTKQVASTLLEEWVHNKHGCSDFDRKMQSWLFDKILSIGEDLQGEPI